MEKIGNTGYGQTWKDGKCKPAHRASYELFVGPIPEGLCVLHRCDVKSCVNPHHLFLGTHKDNVLDMFKKGRERERRGEKSGTAKLTEEDILSIRTDRRLQKIISKEYGITVNYVSQIKMRVRWKHL